MSHATGQDATTGPLGCRVDRYATEHGLQVATVRKRIQRGQLAGYKGADHRWYVLEDAPPDATPRGTRDRTGHATRQDATGAVAVNANARAQLEAIRDEWLQPLVETISQQAERIGRLEAERDGVRAQLEAQVETIAELRRRAEVAEVERARRREEEAGAAALLRRRIEQERRNREAAQAAQDAPGPTEGLGADKPGPAPAAGLWARVRRVFGGVGGRG